MQASLGQSGGELGVGDGWGCPQETDVECRLVFRELPPDWSHGFAGESRSENNLVLEKCLPGMFGA